MGFFLPLPVVAVGQEMTENLQQCYTDDKKINRGLSVCITFYCQRHTPGKGMGPDMLFLQLNLLVKTSAGDPWEVKIHSCVPLSPYIAMGRIADSTGGNAVKVQHCGETAQKC